MYEYLINYPDVLSVQDLIRILPLGETCIYKLLREGKIKHLNVGNKFIIPKKCLIEYLDSAA